MSKIINIIGAIIGIFAFGFLRGKQNEQNERLREDYENMWKDNKIIKEADDTSFADRSDFLLSKRKDSDDK